MSSVVLSQEEILRELSPAAEKCVNRHLKMAKSWMPHDYVPWDRGRNFSFLGGEDYSPEQSKLSELAKAAMITNLLTEDNLPSYHREIATGFSMDDAWGFWTGRWTAEENRHGIAMRDYLVVSRAVDPVKLEEHRMVHMTQGASSVGTTGFEISDSALHLLAYVTFQELATRVSHRNTGKVCDDPVADRLLQRIAADENLHMVFYRDMMSAAFDLVPDQALQAVTDVLTNFQMPGVGMPDFRRNGVLMAKHGIYDLRQHQTDVVLPVLKKWKVFSRSDFSPAGQRTLGTLGEYLEVLDGQASKFEEMRDRSLAREAARRARLT